MDKYNTVFNCLKRILTSLNNHQIYQHIKVIRIVNMLTLFKILLFYYWNKCQEVISNTFKKKKIMKYSIVVFLVLISMVSCDDYNDEIFEIAGVYQASIVGDRGSFDMPISIDYGDNIIIEAPFDGSVWDIVYADIDCTTCDIKEIKIEEQQLEQGVFIQGYGAYSYGSIQLDYSMLIFNDEYEFTLIATK